MTIYDIDITQVLRESLPVDSFLFNPSIAQISGDTYLVSVRSFIRNTNKQFNDEPKLVENPQHPWGTDWKGTDVTYILPMVITEDHIQPITSGGWPITVPVQDMRIFRFMKDGNNAVFVLTYNERYEDNEDLIIKGGDYCDEYCYLIGWSYLLVDINSLKYKYLPGEKPMCRNISNPVEKNWSLWNYQENDKLYLMVSYALTPIQSAFSLILKGVRKGEIVANSTCRMTTVRPQRMLNILGELEKYYDNNLIVSLSTPSYPVGDDMYQAVGHIKVRIDYMRKMANNKIKGKNGAPLADFARKYVKGRGKKHFNPNYVYLMFVYRFKIIEKGKGDVSVDIDGPNSGAIELTGSDTRIYALITHITPAFVSKVGEYDYFLNFPSGMVVTPSHTLISYGDGDATAHLASIANDDLDNMLVAVTDLTPRKFQFLHGNKNGKGLIKL